MTETIKTTRALVAGATGHIGSHVVRALQAAGIYVRALARDKDRMRGVRDACDEVFVGEATRAQTLTGVCDGVDVVISSLGARSLRGDPPVAEVDLGANQNLLEHARLAGVRHFVFVGVINGETLAQTVPILRPRETFVRNLKASGMTWTVLRPTGAFNDMEEIFRAASRGFGIVLGPGTARINPIHAADIAAECVRSVKDESYWNAEFDLGGAETYSQRELVELAHDALSRRARIVSVPPSLVDAVAAVTHPFNENAAGFLRFFRNSATRDMVGRAVGTHSLAAHFRALAAQRQRVRSR